MVVNKDEKVAIRIHTMLGRIKLYEVDSYRVEMGELVINGTNSTTGHTGEFHYPMQNYEHFNVIRGYSNINELR
jgi:hypothetical protein